MVAETDALVEQREAALTWLKPQAKGHVFVSLHPQTEWTIAWEDGEDGEDDDTAEEGGDEPEAWGG